MNLTKIQFYIQAICLHFIVFFLIPKHPLLEKTQGGSSSPLEEKASIRIKDLRKQLIDTKLEPSKETPKEKAFPGRQNHIAEKETRTKSTPNHQRDYSAQQNHPSFRSQNRKPSLSQKQNKKGIGGLLPDISSYSAASKLGGVEDLSDHVEIDLGDQLDVNSVAFRYSGYFSQFRQSFLMVWTYPRQALQLRLAGTTTVRFGIKKDGEIVDIKVVQSSGHHILDQQVVKALNEMSYHAPLPGDFSGDVMWVQGKYSYQS